MLKRTCMTAVVVLLVTALLLPANAGSWSSAKTSGITIVESMLDTSTNTYTWTLTNGSGGPGEPYALIWALQPFNIPAPTAWTAPSGWTFAADQGWQFFDVADNNAKYKTGPSLAPGQSAVFTYTFNPNAPRINPFGSGYEGDPNAIGFLSHVGEVTPGSGTLDGSVKWTPAVNPLYGPTWADKCTIIPVPEPCSLAVFSTGFASFVGLLRRRNCRRS